MPLPEKSRVGIGFCNDKDGLASGTRVAKEALEGGGITRPDLVFAFCSGGMDHEAFFSGLRTVVGKDVPIVGGSAVGLITNDHISYDGAPAGIAIIESNNIRCRVAAVGDVDKDGEAAGLRLADMLPLGPEDKIMLLFYDWVKRGAEGDKPPVLNASAPFLAGIDRRVKFEVPVIGAGIAGSYDLGPTRQFCGSFVNTQHAVGVVLSGFFHPYFSIVHGCTPIDGIYRTITRMEGSVIYELDGMPVADIIDGLFGSRQWRDQRPVNLLTIGVNYGEKYGEPREENYVNRLIIGALPDGSGISMFEPDLEEGVDIQFMLRDTRKMMESARKNSANLLDAIATDGKRAVFAMYIDCAGRTMQYSGAPSEEAAEVQEICNNHRVPLLGFYSGVEIAPFLHRSRGLDWSGVLVVLAEDL
jgi:hypothetical protein